MMTPNESENEAKLLMSGEKKKKSNLNKRRVSNDDAKLKCFG